MSSRKKLTLAILIILTVVLAGVSIYVTLRLQESQAPTETGAATGSGFTNCCGTGIGCSAGGPTCNGGCSGTSCSGPGVKLFKCNGRHNECGGSGAGPFYESPWTTSASVPTGECGITVQIDVFAQQSYSNLRDYIVYYTGDCTTTPQPPAPQPPPGGGKAVCGESCSKDSDCIQPNGTKVICNSNKKCASAGCPNDTEYGTICYCKKPTGKCGDRCGYWSDGNQPLCGDGISSCSWINGPTCGGNNKTYCLPKTVDPSTGYEMKRCGGDLTSYKYIVESATGKVVTDINIIKQLCNPPQTIKCYRCTTATNDANACESQDFTGTSCPAGWTTNSSCASAQTGGACPVDIPQITCYRCTVATNDGNACDSQQFEGTSCPTGWTTNSSCAAAETGGACPVIVQCGQACTGDAQCPNNHTCNAGICKLNACLTPGVCSDNACTLAQCGDGICNTGELCERTTPGGTSYKACTGLGAAPTGADVPNCTFSGTAACQQVQQVACGEACSTDANCPNGHTCNAGICKLDACLTPGACSDNSCTPVGPVCGASCASTDQCPGNHSCISGKCTLNGCTSTSCANGCTPLCGGPCSTDANCPNNHSCQAGKCVLNGCTPSTCTNGCSTIPTIPDTAIGDDARLLVIGTLFIVAGYATFKLSGRKNLLSSLVENMSASYEDKAEKRLKDKAEK